MKLFPMLEVYRYHLIDWSSRNVFVAKIRDTLMFCDSQVSQTVKKVENFDATNVCLVKWSDSGRFVRYNLFRIIINKSWSRENKWLLTRREILTGDKLIICTTSSRIKVYSVEKQKMIWTQKCASVIMFDTPCVIRCACWSKDDQLVVAWAIFINFLFNTLIGMLE